MACAVNLDAVFDASPKNLLAQKKGACINGSRNSISTNVSLTQKPEPGDTLVIAWNPGTVTATVNSTNQDGLTEITITAVQGNPPGLEVGQTITINVTW
jgi:hypothetical protein